MILLRKIQIKNAQKTNQFIILRSNGNSLCKYFYLFIYSVTSLLLIRAFFALFLYLLHISLWSANNLYFILFIYFYFCPYGVFVCDD